MSESVLSCPSCGFHEVVKNGQTAMESQITSAKTVVVNTFDWVWRGNLVTPLGQFVENPKWRRIAEETQDVTNKTIAETKEINFFLFKIEYMMIIPL